MWKGILIFAAGVIAGVVGSHYANGVERGYLMGDDSEPDMDFAASGDAVEAEG